MLYQFPPPTWFEPGTTSQFVSLIVALVVIFGLPGSILACWLYRPKSRPVWIFGVLFWSSSLLLGLAIVLDLFPQQLLQSLPLSLSLTVIVMLIVLAFPATLAGWDELLSVKQSSFGFRDFRTWGCATPFAMLILGYFMTPTLGPHREASRRSQCKTRLKVIGLAMHSYLDTFHMFPDTQFQSEKSVPRSWRVELLPYLDHHKLADLYDSTQSWDSPQNLQIAKDFDDYTCPSIPQTAAQDLLGRKYTAYAALAGPDTVFAEGKGRSTNDITDGSSNTVLIAEACGQQIVWTEPRDIELTRNNLGINLPGDKPGTSPASWSSYHRGAVHTLLADGSVRALSTHTDVNILRAITTATSGEPVGDF